MKRRTWVILSILLLIILAIPALVAAWISLPSELPASASEELSCSYYGIDFNASSIHE
jgi:hypothetical protein